MNRGSRGGQRLRSRTRTVIIAWHLEYHVMWYYTSSTVMAEGEIPLSEGPEGQVIGGAGTPVRAFTAAGRDCEGAISSRRRL
jgi:hypothetical protein